MIVLGTVASPGPTRIDGCSEDVVCDVVNHVGARAFQTEVILRRHGYPDVLLVTVTCSGLPVEHQRSFPKGSQVGLRISGRYASIRNLDTFEVLEDLVRRDLTPSPVDLWLRDRG
jgi:hypothetical protein